MTGRVWPYEHRDEDTGSTWLGISPEAGHGAKVEVLGGNWVTVANLLPIVAALYAAAGAPEPFILERTDGSPARGIINLRHEDGRVSINGAQLAPDRARRVAAAIVAEAEAAENEPDPSEVTELTQVLRDAMQGGPAKAAAIAALRWMKQRQERQP